MTRSYLQFWLFCTLLFGLTTAASAIERGQIAPDFELPVLQQEQAINLAQYRGKVIYVDFWASYCVACRLTVPVLNQLKAQFGEQGFEVLAVNIDEHQREALAEMQKQSLNYPVLWDQNGEVAHDYGVQVLPSGYLVDAQGTVRLVQIGMSQKHQQFLAAVIDKLLAERIN